MTARRQIVVEGTSREELQRALDLMGEDLGALEAHDIPFMPGDSADWVSPAPATVGDALDRLAAAGGVTPVP